MKTIELLRELRKLSQAVSDVKDLEVVSGQLFFGFSVSDPFTYGGISEQIFERFLKQVGKKREYTWSSDLSLAEWCEPIDSGAVLDTCINAVKYWHSNEECMAEFLLSLAIKASEHKSRGNAQWSCYYSKLYDALFSLICRYYENDEKNTLIFGGISIKSPFVVLPAGCKPGGLFIKPKIFKIL